MTQQKPSAKSVLRQEESVCGGQMDKTTTEKIRKVCVALFLRHLVDSRRLRHVKF